MRSISRHILISLLAIHTCSAISNARNVDIDAVWQSIQEQRKSAAAGVIPKRFSLEYTVELHFPIDSQSLSALKAQVEGKPDHPAHADIEMHESYLREGPRRRKVRLWVSPDGLCRVSSEYMYGSFRYSESAIGRNSAWMFTAKSLVVADTKGALAPPTRNPVQVVSGNREESLSILYGAHYYAASLPATKDRLRVHGDEWILGIDLPDGGRAKLEGYWEGRTGVALATHASREPGPIPEGGLVAIRSKDWDFRPELDQWVPRVVEFDSGPRRYKVLMVSSAAPSEQAEIEALTRTPALDRPDPIRGPLTVSSISDYISDPASDGILTSMGSLSQESPPKGNFFARVQWLAFGAAASLALLLVAIRVRQARRKA